MRPREKEYNIYPKRIRGKIIFYYWYYDDSGKRRTRTTGKTKDTDAIKYCRDLYSKGLLFQSTKYLFAQFVEPLFLYDTCPYIKARKKNHSYSRTWAARQRSLLEKYLIPHFSSQDIRLITDLQIADYLSNLEADNINRKTLNHIIAAMRVIFSYAIKLKFVTENPAKEIEYYRIISKQKGVFTKDEEERLFFSTESSQLWESKKMYLLHRTALVTGMRLGEIIALRWCDIHDSYISVQHAWNPLDGLKETKTEKPRYIPINKEHKELFEELYKDAPTSVFVFSRADGSKPIDHKTIYRALYQALSTIGIPENIRKQRNITFHSFRHNFNNVLLKSGMSPETIRLYTGHSTAGMTARYSHLQAIDLELPYCKMTIAHRSKKIVS